MSPAPNIPLIYDISVKTIDANDLLRNCGFQSYGEVERFLSAWSDAIDSLADFNRPQCILFVLVNRSGSTPHPQPARSTVLATIDSIKTAQSNDSILIVGTDASVLGTIKIPQAIKQRLQGGKWLRSVASQFSVGGAKDKCICFASKLIFEVYVNGTLVEEYADVVRRISMTALDFISKQSWGDGELLERCGREELVDTGDHGVWHFPAIYVLKNKPEKRMQERLHAFLKQTLLGYKDLKIEYHVDNEGRVDITIWTADDRIYFVEIKWVGRALSGGGLTVTEAKVKSTLKGKWKGKCVTCYDEAHVKKGVFQLEKYLLKKFANVEKGFLVVYDCRPNGIARGTEAANEYPRPKKLDARKVKVWHVAVSPLTASRAK